jgi:hypothetical protein
MNEIPLTIKLVDALDVTPQSRAQQQRAKRNSDWLQAHWSDLLPQARGKYLAVAGEEAFVADTPEEARAMAHAAHPDDDGALSRYVFPNIWPRIYAYLWRVASW